MREWLAVVKATGVAGPIVTFLDRMYRSVIPRLDGLVVSESRVGLDFRRYP